MTATATKPDWRFLTPKQRRVLEFLCDFHASHGRMPSYREMIKGMDYASTNSVAVHLKQLERKGFIAQDHFLAGSIRVIAAPGPDWIQFPGHVSLRRAEAEAWQRKIVDQLVDVGVEVS